MRWSSQARHTLPAGSVLRCVPARPPPAHITPSSAAQIQECKRLLRPGGVLAFVDINPDRFGSQDGRWYGVDA